jgi:hypothetical protein
VNITVTLSKAGASNRLILRLIYIIISDL